MKNIGKLIVLIAVTIHLSTPVLASPKRDRSTFSLSSASSSSRSSSSSSFPAPPKHTKLGYRSCPHLTQLTPLQQACFEGQIFRAQGLVDEKLNATEDSEKYFQLSDMAERCLPHAAVQNYYKLFEYFELRGLKFSEEREAPSWLLAATSFGSNRVVDFLLAKKVCVLEVLKWPLRIGWSSWGYRTLNLFSGARVFTQDPSLVKKIYSHMGKDDFSLTLAWEAIEKTEMEASTFRIGEDIREILKGKKLAQPPRSKIPLIEIEVEDADVTTNERLSPNEALKVAIAEARSSDLSESEDAIGGDGKEEKYPDSPPPAKQSAPTSADDRRRSKRAKR